jgi:hypothetical protein
MPPPRGSPADERITRRLRLFFGLITCLIIPTAISLLCLLVYYIVSVQKDKGSSCDAPLEAYAYFALFMFVYSLHHRHVKKLLFSYDRERDGPRRPPNVLAYDRCYQVLFLSYAVTGVCFVSSAETCPETAPSLFLAAYAFVCVQCALLGLLLLPLMCVPCIFVWLMRQGFLFGEVSLSELGL